MRLCLLDDCTVILLAYSGGASIAEKTSDHDCVVIVAPTQGTPAVWSTLQVQHLLGQTMSSPCGMCPRCTLWIDSKAQLLFCGFIQSTRNNRGIFLTVKKPKAAVVSHLVIPA